MFPVHRLKVRIEHPAFYLETDDIHGTVNMRAIEQEHWWLWFLLILTGINKIGLTENIEKRIIITRGGISYMNTCAGGVDNGSNERFKSPFG